MYGCESWTIKKAEHQRIDAFELWCWRRLLRVPWTSMRFNQSILKEINPEYSLEDLKLKVTLQYFGQPDVKNWFIGRDPDAGKDWRQEKKGPTEDEIVEWHYWLDGHEFEQALGSWWWTGKPGVLQSMGSQRVRDDWATELTDWLNFHTEFDRVWESPEIVYRVDVSVYFSAFVIFPRVVLVIPKHICFKITLFCVLCIVCSNYTKLQ